MHMRVIAYASRTLNPAEKNYHLHSSKLELLALKSAECDYFKDYLYHALSFMIYTDNNPLTYLLSTVKLNSTTHRWVAELADYNVSIKYWPGKVNKAPDTLSRMSLDIEQFMKSCTLEASQQEIQAAVSGLNVNYTNQVIWLSSISDDVKLPDIDSVSMDPTEYHMIDSNTLLQAQKDDPVVGRVLTFKLHNHCSKSHELEQENQEVKALLREWNHLFIDTDGILKRKTINHHQLVLPRKFCKIIYHELHQEMGHLGPEHVLQLCRERFFWPWMQDDITHFVTKVCNCLRQRKPNVPIRAPLQSFVASSPFELISIDFMHLEKSSGGYEYILLIVESFTRFAQAYPCKNKSAHTPANTIYNDFILRFGFPSRIHHDQGTEIENDLFHELEKLCGVVRSRTTPYHPQGNGQVERMNCTLVLMHRTLPEDQKGKWKDHLYKVIHAYNSTKHEATGYSPFVLLFGCSPRLPIDLIFGTYPSSTPIKYRNFVKNWKTAMQEAYALANKRSVKSLAKGRDYHDRKPHSQD